MSWQYSDAPSHISPETGPNLLTGPGPWTVTLEPGQEYVLTVDVLGTGDTLVEWQVSVTDSDGEVLEYPAEGETVPGGEWVTVTRPLTAPAFEASASVALTAAAETRDPSLAALTGRMVLTVPGDVLAETIMASGGIVAGTPGGARVELTDEGLSAFDVDGTETAQIRGVGGEFVGGVFRTSDGLSGQVVFADDAVWTHYDSQPRPGISITPTNPSGFESLPGIGPSTSGLTIYGGKKTGTGATLIQAHPESAFMRTMRDDGTTAGTIAATTDLAQMRTYRADGSSTASLIQATDTESTIRTNSGNSVEAGWVRVQPQDAELAYVAPDNTYFSRIKVDANQAFLYTRAGGATRYLIVDADGIWASTHKGGSWKHYNLEETAQDSGWQAITPATGYQNASGGAPFEYRRMGRMIHLRGRVSATSGVLTAGTAYTIGTLPAAVRPAYTHRTIIAGGSTSAWGRIDISGGTGALSVAPISANMDWVDLAGTMWTAD